MLHERHFLGSHLQCHRIRRSLPPGVCIESEFCIETEDGTAIWSVGTVTQLYCVKFRIYSVLCEDAGVKEGAPEFHGQTTESSFLPFGVAVPCLMKPVLASQAKTPSPATETGSPFRKSNMSLVPSVVVSCIIVDQFSAESTCMNHVRVLVLPFSCFLEASCGTRRITTRGE